MKEVSCRFFDALLVDLRARGIDPALLVVGTTYDVRRLTDKDERVDWPAFLRMMENGRAFWSREDLIRIGERSTESPMVQFIGVVARLRFSVNGFYHWVADPEGVAKQMFNCLHVSCHDDGPGRVNIELRMRPGYEPSREMFWVSQGTYAAMPRMLGAPASTVSAEMLPDGVRFHVQYVEPRGPAALIRRVIRWPFNLRQAADELNDAHQSLQARYADLDAARDAVDRQRALLQTAFLLGQRALAQRDPDTAIQSVLEGLVHDSCVAGAEITLSGVHFQAGTRRGVSPAVRVDLRLSRGLEGVLDAWPRQGAVSTQVRTLLELIAPTVALTIDNAHAYRELADYQQTLERRVDERTHDLSEARDALAATVKRLEEVQQDRERLFQNISHEFRTPLALILLSVDAVLAVRGGVNGTADEQRAAHLGTVTSSARKLVRMVDELLLLAAGRERELQVHPQPIDLHEAVTAAAAGWMLAAQAAGQTLTVEAPAGVIALVDPLALERVLANLLSNAVKFSPPGGRITVRIVPPEPPRELIEITVADTGIGIDDDLRARLFGRFEQGKGGIATRGGSGIGLSLVRELVRAHGGEVGARPNPGGGTVFWFQLPLSHAQPSAPPPTPRLAPSDFGVMTTPVPVIERLEPPGTSRGTVLLAEDDLALAGSIARILAEDHHVIVAHDGATALALAEQHQPDLLITDVQMPGMDGFELTRRFREIPGVPPASVLVLTARAGIEDRLHGFGVGAVDYLTKPFDPVELRARVRAQLGHRDLTRRLYESEKLASLGALSAGLAHELRNPANGIVNAVAPLKEMLPLELADPEHPVTQLIDVMAECADQIGYLSRQLLGFRRSGDLELRRVPIADVIDRALANASGALTGIDLRTKTTYTGPVRCAVPVISQVLVNLLENAAHAAGPGGWIELATTRHDGRVGFEVTDSGPGVPVHLRDRIFEPFFTTKPPGHGTGLGLATSRDLVQRHGGTLELRNRGDRTVFAVDLPEPPEVS